MRDFRAFVREHLKPLALPRRRELTVVDELAAELEASYDAMIAAGRSDAEAWTELQRQLPDWTLIREELLDSEPALVRFAQPERERVADVAPPPLISRLRALVAHGLARDLRSSVRLFGRNRGFAASTIMTLAVALGANAAIFTVVYSLLLRPLPFPASDRVVALGDVYPTISANDILSNAAPSYFDRLEALTTLEAQALLSRWSDTIATDGVAEEIRGLRVTPSFFRVTQVPPALGRAFTEPEGEIGAEHSIILSHGLWQRLYGGNPGAIDRDLRLGWTGQRYTIVGVMPPGFSFLDPDVQFWLPLALTPAQKSYEARTRYYYFHVGRLRPEATTEQLRAQVDALNATTFKRFPELGLAELGMYTSVTRLQEALTRGVRRILYLLWAGAAFVLLIAVVNVINLTLVRSTDRSRELATRLALGAARLRVTRQLILEGVLLSGIAGLASLAFARWLLHAMTAGDLPAIANVTEVQMDGPTIALTIGSSLLIGSLVGLVPAAGVRNMNVNQVLAEGGRRGSGGRATRLFRRALVVTQVAVSVVLLVGAALLSLSFRTLLSVDPGFEPRRVISATIFPPPSRYADQRAMTALSHQILEAVRRIPGVQGAGITSNIALSGGTSPASVAAADADPQPDDQVILPAVVAVTPGYFEAMGTTLVRGRYFSDQDREGALPAAIVDERLAARLWPNGDPIGKGIFRGTTTVRYTVVGLVRNVRFEGMTDEAIGAAYFPQAQAPPLGRLRWIAIRTAAEPHGVMRAVRSALMQIDPDLPLSNIQTMSERISRSLLPQRLAMRLAGMFGLVALFLSILGVYSVLSHVVAQRWREIAIRIALGSTLGRIFHLVFTEGLALVAVGLAIGLFGAIAAGRAMAGEIFGVNPTDPKLLGGVMLLTGIIALAACLSPARRATRVNPLDALSEH